MSLRSPSRTYGFGTTIDLPYEDAVEGTRAALKEQGFGVLTEIDIRQTLKEKLDVDFRRYVILGVGPRGEDPPAPGGPEHRCRRRGAGAERRIAPMGFSSCSQSLALMTVVHDGLAELRQAVNWMSG